MNEQNTPITSGTAQKVLMNFAFLTNDSLRSLADALGLKMGLSELRFCLDYFKHERLPDPTVGELLTFDRVYADRSRRTNIPLIASFMTNDKTVAETYADLMTRRKAVEPDYTAPCSLPKLLEILPAYANRDSNSDEVKLFTGKERFANAASEHYRVFVSGSGSYSEAAIGLKDSRPYLSTPEWGNAVYAVLKSFNDIPSFEEKLNSFTVSADVAAAAKQIDLLDGECIVTLLAERFSGINLNAAPYEAIGGAESPFSMLSESDFGIIITAAKEKAADMLIAAQELGLRVILLGSVNGSMKITSTSSKGLKLSLDINLLKSLAFSHPVSCEADSTQLVESFYEKSYFPVINGKRYRISSAEHTVKNAFISGYNSVLYAYSLALLGGTEKMSFAGAYTVLPDLNSKKSLGLSVELILGAYRAQCELGIYDGHPSVAFGEKIGLRFHSLTEVKKYLPSKIVGKDSYVYYLEPLYREDGLPDTEDMRKMHDYISGLINDGIIISACPTGENLIKTLDRMSEDTCVEYIRRDELSSHFGGFIVETTQRIQGALIARSAREPAILPTDTSVSAD